MTTIRATVHNALHLHEVWVQSNDSSRSLSIPAKASGYGSGVSGGELLFLALATCYCNDLYREAAKRNITIQRVEVEVSGEFSREGGPASGIQYSARVQSDGDPQEVQALMRYTDTVAEIQNTLRSAAGVTLSACEVIERL